MRNIQLIIEYDGTNYCGWQMQQKVVGVQEIIGEAIKQITNSSSVRVIGSGRTDAGVHALGQSANFMTESTIPINRIPTALNSILPRDIRIVQAIEKNLEFHSRYHAIGKVYQYKILNNKYGSAINRNNVFHVRNNLDIIEMKRAATFFLGTHDFTGFSSANSSVQNKVRTIVKSDIEVKGDLILYTVQGSGFLYNMVRIIVGTLVTVGIGKIDAECIPHIIQSKNRIEAGATAPAQGLYLQEVLYENIDTLGYM